MREYSIGEAADILGVKHHVLRYWEQEIPLLSPRKDGFGRRIYAARDVQMLLRVRYLVHEAGYTVRGASDRILAELTGSEAGYKARLQAVRDQLLPLVADAASRSRSGERRELQAPDEWKDQVHLFGNLESYSGRELFGLVRRLNELGRSYYELLRDAVCEAASSSQGDTNEVLPAGSWGSDEAIPVRNTHLPSSAAHDAVEQELHTGGQLLFTPELRLGRYELPESSAAEKELFAAWAEAIREDEYEYGRAIHWLLPVHQDRRERIERLFSARRNFGLAEDRVTFLDYRDIPVLNEQGLLLPTKDRAVPWTVPDPQTASMLALLDSRVPDLIVRRSLNRVWVRSLLRPTTRVFSLPLAALQRHEGAEICIESERLSHGRYAPTGTVVLLPTLLLRSGAPMPLRISFERQLNSAGEVSDTEKRTARPAMRFIDLYYWSEHAIVAAQGA